MYGSRIRDLRMRNNYTQETLADKVNVSYKTVGSWEREDRLPPVDKLSQLADLFGVTLDYLMGRDTDDGLLVAAHMDDDLTDEQKKEIQEYIEFKKAQYRKQHEKD